MQSRVVGLGLWLVLFVLPATLPAQSARVGKNTVVVRGQWQDIYFYSAIGESNHPKGAILFAPGDGGWRGFAITIAQTVASWGYDVYGLDTKRYLESFTGKTTLKETEVMSDFRTLAGWITHGTQERVTLVGWSEGAGLCLLAAAAEENKTTFVGLISVGLTESNILGWRWSDFMSYITKRDPNEPKFLSVDYLSKVAPLPLLMIHATRDEYVSVATSRKLFAAASEPKRVSLIEADNHRFDGNREEFFRVLREGLTWIGGVAH